MNRFERSIERKEQPNTLPVLKVGSIAPTQEELEVMLALLKIALDVLRETAYKLKKSSQYLSKMSDDIDQALRQIG